MRPLLSPSSILAVSSDFQLNGGMTLPIYNTINLRSASLDDLGLILNTDLNLRHPVVINLKPLDVDQQREAIGIIENFFVSHNISFKFPYAIYLLTDHEESISRMPTVNNMDQLPKFFTQKETKMNVKETHVIGKNKLIQQELKNIDAATAQDQLTFYGHTHRKVAELEQERLIYRSILNQLMKAKKTNG